MTNQTIDRCVAIGASAGGFKAVVRCLADFKGREDAVFVVVLHGFSEIPGFLVEQMAKLIQMPVSYAENDRQLKGGQVFIGPPDHHLMVSDGRFKLTNGPKENMFQALHRCAVSLGGRGIWEPGNRYFAERQANRRYPGAGSG